MKIDVYTATGVKKGSVELPAAMFEATINKGLMHLALVRQQSNRRHSIAHVKHRGEVVGSTKKIFQQKGTGNARRGAIRSPLMKGGGKAFGPRKDSNFVKEMPKKMRRAALFSCLSLRASEGAILGLESYPDEVKTKTFMNLLKKLPVEIGRKITIVMAAHQRGLELSARNVPRVKTILAQYLNPEDVLGSQRIIFLVDALKVAEQTFLKTNETIEKKAAKIKKADEKPRIAAKKAPVKHQSPAQKKAAAEAKKVPKKKKKSTTSSKSAK